MKKPAQTKLPERSSTRRRYEEQLPAHRATLQGLVQEVRQLLEPTGLTPAIRFRIKAFDAYFEKLRRARERGRLHSNISDFFGLRIVCPFLEDIDTVERLLAAHFDVIETESKAEQHSFREFGYDSLHLLIRLNGRDCGKLLPGVRRVCEIQLRTILQDAWAEVEHELVYKSDISLPNQSIRRKLASLNATLTLSDLIFQEIRDYQKTLRRHGRKRRASLEDTFGSMQLLDLAQPVAAHLDAPENPTPLPSVMTSPLEKIMLRALEAHGNQEFGAAINLYTQILGMKLERAIRSLVYNHRGLAYVATGDSSRALRDFSRAIEYGPESERGYLNRATCLSREKKFAAALADFDRALALNPYLADAYYGRARVHCERRETTPALADCEKALEIQADHQPAKELLKLLKRPS